MLLCVPGGQRFSLSMPLSRLGCFGGMPRYWRHNRRTAVLSLLALEPVDGLLDRLDVHSVLARGLVRDAPTKERKQTEGRAGHVVARGRLARRLRIGHVVLGLEVLALEHVEGFHRPVPV